MSSAKEKESGCHSRRDHRKVPDRPDQIGPLARMDHASTSPLLEVLAVAPLSPGFYRFIRYGLLSGARFCDSSLWFHVAGGWTRDTSHSPRTEGLGPSDRARVPFFSGATPRQSQGRQAALSCWTLGLAPQQKGAPKQSATGEAFNRGRNRRKQPPTSPHKLRPPASRGHMLRPAGFSGTRGPPGCSPTLTLFADVGGPPAGRATPKRIFSTPRVGSVIVRLGQWRSLQTFDRVRFPLPDRGGSALVEG